MAQAHIATHYDNLKVARNSPPEVIRAAYRALAQKYHPDRYPDQARGTRIMRVINEAYEVLSDPARRREHDAWIAEQEAQAAAGNGGRHARGGFASSDMSAERAGNSKSAGETTGGGSQAGPGRGQFNEPGRFRQADYGKASNPGGYSGAGRNNRLGWVEFITVSLVLPFYFAAQGLKWLFKVAGIALRWLLKVALIAFVAFLAVKLLFLQGDAKPSAPINDPAARAPLDHVQPQRPLQDVIREIVVEGRRGLPRQMTDEIWLVAVDEAQNQVVRTHELVGISESSITASAISEMQQELDEKFRESLCRNKTLLPLFQRGMSFAQIYKLADTKRRVLTTVHSLRNCQ